ncbi:hypothetical protein ACOSQ3_013649 [Xanthoceras sorbifolium]
MKFNEAEFWVQVHNIPIVCMNRETGLFIGKQIGVLREIDLGTTGDCLGKYLRVRVRVDISKPLKCRLRLELEDGEDSVLLLRGEGLRFRALAAGVQPSKNSTGPYGAAPQATAPAEQPPSAMPIPNVMGSGVKAVLVMENVPVPVHEIAPSGLVVGTGDMLGKSSTLHNSIVDQTLAMYTATMDVEGDSSTSPGVVVPPSDNSYIHSSMDTTPPIRKPTWKRRARTSNDSRSVEMEDLSSHKRAASFGEESGSQRQHSWTLLRRLQHQLTLPWLCGGDFNEILSSSEKEGGVNRPRFLINNFRQLALFPFVTVHYLDFCFSDHRPILVTFYPNPTSSYAAYFSCSVARLRAPVAEFASLGYRSQAPHGVSCKSKSVSLMTSCVKMRSIRGSVLALLGWPAVEAKVSPAMNRALDGKFSAVEVHAALKQMHPFKALGLDGIPALFYHKNWKVVVLILKIPQAQHMTDFWPISLCNVLYKIIAKTLANRLRLVLGQIILDSQRWRILLNLGSLVSRVLKSLYFSNCDFLQAKSSGFHLVGFKSDASSVISSILSKDPPLSEMGLVISDILALVSLLSVSHISFAPRSCNGVAHQLARFGLSIPNFLAWIEEDPPCAVDSILSDSCL